MSLILNIDTATDTACVSIARDGEVISASVNTEPKGHGGFLQPAIKSLLKDVSLTIQDLDAVAISAGPGSYTGLRVGMAAAKGMSYALKKPLITVGTLDILAFSAMSETSAESLPAATLFCPMIDARRMEVFAAVYTRDMKVVIEPCVQVLEKKSFANCLLKNKILFFGNGHDKWELICTHENALFAAFVINPLAMSILAYKKFLYNDFANLAYSEPRYIKPFYEGSSAM